MKSHFHYSIIQWSYIKLYEYYVVASRWHKPKQIYTPFFRLLKWKGSLLGRRLTLCFQVKFHTNGLVVVIFCFKVVTGSRGTRDLFPICGSRVVHSNQHGHSSRDCLFAVGTILLDRNKIANSDTLLIERWNFCPLLLFTSSQTTAYETACLVYDVNQQILYLYVNYCFCFQLSPSIFMCVCVCVCLLKRV